MEPIHSYILGGRNALEIDASSSDVEVFEFVYDGPEVKDGSISARDLIESVSGLNRAFSIISDEYETAERYQIRIRDLRKNSIHIVFEAIAFAKANPGAAAAIGSAVTASAAIGLTAVTNLTTGAYKILTDLGVIVEVKKKLRGRRVARQQARFPDGNVELNTGDEYVTLTKEQYELLLSQKLDKQLAQIVSPLAPARVDQFRIESKGQQLADVAAVDRDSFDFNEVAEERSKDGTEIVGTLNSLNKTNLRGTFHTEDGVHVPYKYIGGNIARLLRGFTSREPVRVTGRVKYGADDIPRLVEVDDIQFIQGNLLEK